MSTRATNPWLKSRLSKLKEIKNKKTQKLAKERREFSLLIKNASHEELGGIIFDLVHGLKKKIKKSSSIFPMSFK